MTDRARLNDDFADLLDALHEAGVEFLIVGAHALAVHGIVRSTGDLDVFVRPNPDNADRLCAALRSFGAPLAAHGIAAGDFARPGTVYQLGLPPRRIDILTSISGVEFEDAWADSQAVEIEGVRFRVPSRATLLINKRTSARPKDLEDVRQLEALPPTDEEPV